MRTAQSISLTIVLLTVISIIWPPNQVQGQPPLETELIAWFSAESGLVQTENGDIQWIDGHAGHILTASSGGGLEHISNSVNGLDTLQFSGESHLSGSIGDSTSSEVSIFCIFKYGIEDSNNDYLYTLGIPGASGSQVALSRLSGKKAYHYDGSRQNVSSDDAIPHDEWLISSQTVGGAEASSHKLYINGASVLSTQAGDTYSPDLTYLTVGNWSSGAFRFIGEIAELYIYKKSLNESQRTEVEEYLRAKAGLPPFFKEQAEILSSWEIIQYELEAQPDAVWEFDLGGTRADQHINADASILLGPDNLAGKTIWGQMGSGDAPDFMGFVFAYTDQGNFYLFDWKKQTAAYQNFGTAQAGMRLTSFHLEDGQLPTGRDFWASDKPENTTVLFRNDMPWVNGIDYDFSVRMTDDSIVVSIWQGNSLLESWTVENPAHAQGRFGYYINSLQNVRFGQVFITDSGPLRIDNIIPGQTHLKIGWSGGFPPYTLLWSPDLNEWNEHETNIWDKNISFPINADVGFFQVTGQMQ